MQSRKNLIALSILSWAVAAAIPTRAGTPLSTGRFSLTFPDGWQIIPEVLRSDSAQTVAKTQTGTICLLSVETTSHPLSSQEIDSLRQIYTVDTAFTSTMESKTLGGKSYAIVEIQNKDTSGNFSHSRVYYTTSGSTLFTAIIAFHPDRISGDIAEAESALATLSLSASPIRAVTARTRPAWRVADQDILGRSRLPTARTALFRLPAH